MFEFLVRPVSDRRKMLLFQVEGRGMTDTHITGRHFGGDTHITSDMCVGIHISLGYTYHCDTGSLELRCFAVKKLQTKMQNH